MLSMQNFVAPDIPRRRETARNFANALNRRRCSLVSATPITEKLLLNAGGWQAMKPARELLKSGRVSEAKYEPPLLSGYVREGAKNYRSGLRIKSAIDGDCRGSARSAVCRQRDG